MESKCMKFVKYDNYWWEYDDKTPLEYATVYNMYGGKMTECDLTKCEIVEAKDFEYLDWTNTDLLNNQSKFGWVDRNGKFYGCNFEHHGLQAKLVHRSSRRELEKLGWIIIGKNFFEETDKLIATFWGKYKEGIMPTDAQMLYLSTRPDVESYNVMKAYMDGNREKARIYEQNLKKEQMLKNSQKDDEKSL